RSPLEWNDLALIEKGFVRWKIERVQTQFITLGIIECESCEIMLNLTLQASGNSSQNVCKVKMGNNRVVDFEQDSRAVLRQVSSRQTICAICGAPHNRCSSFTSA